MLHHGGTLFGRVTDDPQSFAKTLLGVIISCIFGRPPFISKMLPIAKLNLYEQIRLAIDAINQSSGEVKAVMCDEIIKLLLDYLIQNHSNHGQLKVVYICYMTLYIGWKT